MELFVLFSSFPTDKFSVIYADPPWTFKTWSTKGKGRSPENHYGCMSLADIRALPVSDIAADNCALFLWVTDPLLPEGLKLMEEWGFKYKTIAFVWVKTNQSYKRKRPLWIEQDFFTGMGYWTRANSELCLLGTRGKPKRQSAAVKRLIIAPRREHSRKPDEVANRITQLMGDVPRIELFARQASKGWIAWGNETEKFNHE
jgi:N6-adenosine-specific RNA methylase IME4